jgi:poly(A) polymerase
MADPKQDSSAAKVERDFALEVVRKLAQHGHEALFAGGCVRDELLGLVPSDHDVATSAPPDEVRKLFRRSLPVGAAFGVVEVLGPRLDGRTIHVQVATFRSDGAYVDGRRPESVHFGSAEQDAQRRDFTINGMFLDPIGGKVIDFVGGRKDLDQKVLRAIGFASDRFREDRLRLLRAARMAARFDLAVDPDTEQAILENAHAITLVSAERIADELRRMLANPNRARALKLLKDWGLFQRVFPGLETPPPELLKTIEGLPPNTPFIGVAALLVPNSREARRISQSLRLSNQETRDITWLVEHIDDMARAMTLPNHALYPILDHPLCELLMELFQAGKTIGDKDPGMERCRYLLANPPQNGFSPPALIDGNMLIQHGFKPGPSFSRVLQTLWHAQLDGLIKTPEEALRLATSICE